MGFDIRKGSYLFKHSIDLEPDNNRQNFREHYHPSYELLYFIKGKADFTLRQQIYHLQHHSLLLIKPGDYHNIIIKEIIPYERMVIRFSPNDIPASLNAKLSASSNVFEIQNTLLERELLHLDKYADILDSSVKEQIFFSELIIILSLLTTSDNLRKKEDKINTSVARVIECIDSNLVEIQTIEDIASKLRMSPSTINKAFLKHMQTPVMSYVRTQKCMMAKNLMISGVPANEAALQAGFEYYSTFYRAYKNAFGVSPTEN